MKSRLTFPLPRARARSSTCRAVSNMYESGIKISMSLFVIMYVWQNIEIVQFEIQCRL